jgi:hypothetical protein
MIEFFYHDGIKKEIVVLERRFHTIKKAFSSFERLCEVQFNPLNPKQVISPAKIHRINKNDIWTLWKVELVVPDCGLRPNQYPRMLFVVKGAVVIFLCISTHVDNYDDKKITDLALLRVTDCV